MYFNDFNGKANPINFPSMAKAETVFVLQFHEEKMAGLSVGCFISTVLTGYDCTLELRKSIRYTEMFPQIPVEEKHLRA